MTAITDPETAPDIQRLRFRRQFLLAPHPFAPTQYWTSIQLSHGLHLSVHGDLPYVSETHNGVSVTLIGIAVDPYAPQEQHGAILHRLVASASDISTLIAATAPLAGRWVIVFQDSSDTYLFTDPCGLRQAFYSSDRGSFWCGSQPAIIAAVHEMPLATDEGLLHFTATRDYNRKQSAWVGAKTVYADCYRLMPNHYLMVSQLSQVRFFPSKAIPIMGMAQAVEASGAILKGIMTALAERYRLSLALTAGWDSRVLLAASRSVSESIQYFVFRSSVPEDRDPDVWVPKRLAGKLGINFLVRRPADELPAWFASMLYTNVTGARIEENTYHILDLLLAHEDRIGINGNVSEICRNAFDKYCRLDPTKMRLADLSHMLGYWDVSFVTQELQEWRESVDWSFLEGLNLLDMLYWEQRLGSWGAQYPAEQDIALEEVSPFNCRSLIETLSATPRHMRAAPDYPLYRELVWSLWPEALSVPINPTPRSDFIRFSWRRVERYVPIRIAFQVKRLRR